MSRPARIRLRLHARHPLVRLIVERLDAGRNPHLAVSAVAGDYYVVDTDTPNWDICTGTPSHKTRVAASGFLARARELASRALHRKWARERAGK